MDDITGWAPRRRRIEITSRGEPLDVSVLDFGDPSRPVDLVFLHANGLNANTYRAMLAPLAEHYRVLAPDLRGHGGTPQGSPAEGRADWLEFRDDLIGLLDALGAGRVVLAGHSMGGAVAALAAPERPERVRGLVLFDPVVMSRRLSEAWAGAVSPPIPDNPMTQAALHRRRLFPSRTAAIENFARRDAFAGWPKEALEAYVADGFRDRPDGAVELVCAPEWEAWNYAAQGHNVWAALERLSVPIHILRAAEGAVCAIRSADDLGPITTRPEVVTVPGSNHFLPIESPTLAREALAAALRP